MIKKSLLLVAGALAFTVSSPASAGNLDWLVFCAGDTSEDTLKVVESDVGRSCNVERGNTDLCSVVDGTPWACSDDITQPAPQPPVSKLCGYHAISFGIKAGITLPLKWTYRGEAKLKFGWNGNKTSRGSCNAKSKNPKVNGKGGSYVSDAGDIFTEVEVSVEGSLVLITPTVPPTEIDFEGKAKCERGISLDYFKSTKVNHCLNCGPPGTPPPTTPPPTTTPGTSKTDGTMPMSATDATTGDDFCTFEPDPYPVPTTTTTTTLDPVPVTDVAD